MESARKQRASLFYLIKIIVGGRYFGIRTDKKKAAVVKGG